MRNRLFGWGLMLLALAAMPAYARPDVTGPGVTDPDVTGPVVATDAGRIAGVAGSNRVTDAFLGIPYAAPPVGDNRWRAPQPVAPWAGVRDASHFGASCVQALPPNPPPRTAEFAVAPPLSEDCLTLNLWKPEGAAADLPVLVYLPGGAFLAGSASVPIYDGAPLAARGIVVVTVNYRVNVFGFLAHPDLSAEATPHSSGNYGLLDQMAALRWVRANIAAFGGNPANVTIAGQSAGASSVNDLLISPLAAGLFHRAVSLSGASIAVDAPPLAEGEANGLALARALGVGSIAALRAVPADKLMAAADALDRGGRRLIHLPHVDGVVLPHDPDLAAASLAVNVPLLTGFTSEEQIRRDIVTPAQFIAHVHRRYGDFAGRLLALYPHANEADVADSAILLDRDRYMTGLVLWAQRRVKASGQPVYTYLYDHPYPSLRGGFDYRSFHTSEVPYIFGTLGLGDRQFTAADQQISRQWQELLLTFMATGDPSTPGRPWPRVTPDTFTVMQLGDAPGLVNPVSSPARFQALRDYAAAGGRLGLV